MGATRFNEFCITVPRLSERKEDIMIFANYFLEQANNELERQVERFDRNVIELFQSYQWPGNLREMKNTIKRSVLLTKENVITMDVLPPDMELLSRQDGMLSNYAKGDEEQAIRQALERANYNKSKAAKLLDIDRKTLYNKLKLYNIEL